MPFTRQRESCDGCEKWISKKLSNGEFDYWLVIDIINMDEAVPDPDYTYMLTLSATSPVQAGVERLNVALKSCGYEPSAELTDEQCVYALSDFGIQATFSSYEGNNRKKLMDIARKEAELIEMMFGFYMDRRQNAIGATGWDFIKGDIGV